MRAWSSFSVAGKPRPPPLDARVSPMTTWEWLTSGTESRPGPAARGGRMRSRLLCWLAAVVVLPASALAQDVKTSQGINITFRGIVDATFFAQDADFGIGTGQRANYVLVERPHWIHGGDARNTRLSVALAGPEVSKGWRGNATVELDFFGAFAGAPSAFADEQPQPRLRLAYADLTNGRTTLRIGQDWDLLFGNVPVLADAERGAAVREVGVREAQPGLWLLVGECARRTGERAEEIQLHGGVAAPPLADLGAGERHAEARVARVTAVNPVGALDEDVIRSLPGADSEVGVLSEERRVDNAAKRDVDALACLDVLRECGGGEYDNRGEPTKKSRTHATSSSSRSRTRFGTTRKPLPRCHGRHAGVKGGGRGLPATLNEDHALIHLFSPWRAPARRTAARC